MPAPGKAGAAPQPPAGETWGFIRMRLAPEDPLFIYEIDGDARAAAAGLGNGYLGLWLEGAVSYLFFSRPAEDALRRLLAAEPGLCLLGRHELSYGQWQGGNGAEPLLLAGLTVLPPGAAEPAGAAGPVLHLDPGLVFGSGLHPTTYHCLELLLLRAARGPLGRVLDLGCGTGILGLAAALLGAESVLAVDLNPLCVSTTAQNAEQNRLAIDIAEGPAGDFLARPAELVLANLHWDAMSGLLEDASAWAGKPDAILSGITRSQVGPLEASLARLGYTILSRREAETTWFTLWASRNAPPGA